MQGVLSVNNIIYSMEKDKDKILKGFSRVKQAKFREPLIALKDITKSYSNNELFCNAAMSVTSDDRIAIAGPNGTGKTTLLKIIVGLEQPDGGRIDRHRGLRIGYLPQETHWDSLKNTVYEEMFSANPEMQALLNRQKELEAKDKEGSLSEAEAEEFMKVLEKCSKKGAYRYEDSIGSLLKDFGFLEDSWQRKIQTLSGGERTKLALAKLLTLDPNLLVLDEPTNHLDIATIEWLEGFLANWDEAIVCVAHDRYFLDKVCNRIFELTKDGFEKYAGTYSSYVEERRKRFESKESGYWRQQKYLEEQKEFINRFRYKASTASRVQSRIKQLDKLELKELPKDYKDIKINFDDVQKVCTKVLSMGGAKVGLKGKFLFSVPERLEVIWGSKIGIIGKNGAGKSTLLKSIMGKQELCGGSIKIDQNIMIGYYDQTHENLDPDKDVLDEVCSKTAEEKEKRVRQVLGSLLFSQDDVYKKIGSLSGGERARVALAELILQKVNLLLLDEPTNHLDLPSKEIITEVIKQFKGTILLVSHDRYILNKACNIIWDVKDGSLEQHLGNYDEYRYRLDHPSSEGSHLDKLRRKSEEERSIEDYFYLDSPD
jgi:ATP-binding cassette subfamily F protein 3